MTIDNGLSSGLHAGNSLPPEVQSRFNGELAASNVIAWAKYDLDDDNRYAERFAVLMEKDLYLLAGDAIRTVPLAQIT